MLLDPSACPTESRYREKDPKNGKGITVQLKSECTTYAVISNVPMHDCSLTPRFEQVKRHR
ncbi:hypothetical protein C8Q76DRAFT_707382 [Earliella scabrosa]|nr:hypothetical protein C8Q76DRAFT_707382 [Earliella scabrosa]